MSTDIDDRILTGLNYSILGKITESSNSMIGTVAVFTNKVQSRIIIAGKPARMIKELPKSHHKLQ